MPPYKPSLAPNRRLNPFAGNGAGPSFHVKALALNAQAPAVSACDHLHPLARKLAGMGIGFKHLVSCFAELSLRNGTGGQGAHPMAQSARR